MNDKIRGTSSTTASRIRQCNREEKLADEEGEVADMYKGYDRATIEPIDLDTK